MNAKRLGFLALLALLVVGVVFIAGCAQKSEKTTEKEKPLETKTPETTQKKEAKDNENKEKTPQIEKKTLKEAFAYLKEKCGISDLKFLSYDTGSMDEKGRAYNYTIAGYSPSKDIVCYVSNSKRSLGKIESHKPTEEVVYRDIKDIKDSPELISEAIAKRGTCAKNSFMFRITPAKDKPAEVLCISSKWIAELDFMKK